MEKVIGKGILFAILAAALYAINSPLSKLLLDFMPPTLMAGFLYVGAGLGMSAVALARKVRGGERKEAKLTAKELPAVHGGDDPFGHCGAHLSFVRPSQRERGERVAPQ